MLKDQIFYGNGNMIVNGAYRIVDALQYFPPARQVQMIALAYKTVIDAIGTGAVLPLEVVSKVVEETAGNKTLEAFQTYFTEKLGLGRR